MTALKEERGILRDLPNHLKAELKEKDRDSELETLKVVTHHSLAPWSSTVVLYGHSTSPCMQFAR